MDHSAYAYVIDLQGGLRYSLPYGTLPEEILRDVRALLPSA